MGFDLSANDERADGLGFEHPAGAQQGNTGFAVSRVRTVRRKGGRLTQAINAGADVPVGWVVVRLAQAELMERARSSFAMVDRHAPPPRVPLDFTVAGMAGAPLGLTATAGGERVTLESSMPLAPAGNRPLDEEKLREQLGRLVETPFVLGRLDRSALADGLFLPVSALNDLRQAAVAELAVEDFREVLETSRNIVRTEQPPVRWIGVARRQFEPIESQKLHALFCEPIVTRSGYAGVVTWLIADDVWIGSVSNVQPGNASRVPQAWQSGVTLAGLSHSHRALGQKCLLLSKGTRSADGRLGGGESARAVAIDGQGWNGGSCGCEVSDITRRADTTSLRRIGQAGFSEARRQRSFVFRSDRSGLSRT